MKEINQDTKIKALKGTTKRQRWDDETIVTKARELFSEKGFDMSMRDLAKSLNTQASSLYRHVQSKRELWFAITTKDYEEFALGINAIMIEKGTTSALLLLRRIGQYFLEFARTDLNRFKLMYLYEPPREEGTGPFEQACKPDSLTALLQVCQMIIQEEDLTKVKAKELAIIVYSQILGYTIISSPINDYMLQQKEFDFIKDPAFDILLLDKLIESIHQFK